MCGISTAFPSPRLPENLQESMLRASTGMSTQPTHSNPSSEIPRPPSQNIIQATPQLSPFIARIRSFPSLSANGLPVDLQRLILEAVFALHWAMDRFATCAESLPKPIPLNRTHLIYAVAIFMLSSMMGLAYLLQEDEEVLEVLPMWRELSS